MASHCFACHRFESSPRAQFKSPAATPGFSVSVVPGSFLDARGGEQLYLKLAVAVAMDGPSSDATMIERSASGIRRFTIQAEKE
jgi:hypothetical protein